MVRVGGQYYLHAALNASAQYPKIYINLDILIEQHIILAYGGQQIGSLF